MVFKLSNNIGCGPYRFRGCNITQHAHGGSILCSHAFKWVSCSVISSCTLNVMNKVIIIIQIRAAFIIFTFPSSTDGQGATCSHPVVAHNNTIPHLQCTISTPNGAFLTNLPLVALQANLYIHKISFTSTRVPIYTYMGEEQQCG